MVAAARLHSPYFVGECMWVKWRDPLHACEWMGPDFAGLKGYQTICKLRPKRYTLSKKKSLYV
jgi:hypothetical protein